MSSIFFSYKFGYSYLLYITPKLGGNVLDKVMPQKQINVLI